MTNDQIIKDILKTIEEIKEKILAYFKEEDEMMEKWRLSLEDKNEVDKLNNPNYENMFEGGKDEKN